MALSLTYRQISKSMEPGRYFDGRTGLHLLVKKNGRKYWVYRFTLNSTRHDKGLGAFPKMPLEAARAAAMNARIMLSKGVSPIKQFDNYEAASAQKQKEVLPVITPDQERGLKPAEEPEKTLSKTFAVFALDWLKERSSEWKNQKHCDQWEYTLSHYAFPVIGRKPLDEINTDDILCILQPIWAGKTTTASRLRSRIERILSAATVLKLRTGPNPSIWRGHLDTILPKPRKVSRVKHHKALPYADLPQFIQELQAREAIAARALEFSILTAARTGEVIGAKWSEIIGNVWCIPAERMKADREHRVPLSPRALTILRQAQRSKHDGDYLFSRNGKPLSNMAMLTLLKRMDVKVTVHGFRSTFRDWVAEETSHSGELAEMALAHTISNKVESAYRRGDLLVPRRQLMLDWEAYCLDSAHNQARQAAA
ncbi:MAG: hypothetical protein RL274_2045 [Pseudomonadota bacterium]|jgi:integrase